MTRQLLIMMIVSIGSLTAMADTVTLKPDVFIKGPTVLLGDVADIAGEHAEELRVIEVARAALPGATRRIDSSLLRSRILNAGYGRESVEFFTSKRIISATTMHIDLSKELLTEYLQDHIYANMPWDPDETMIDIIPPTGKTVVADGDLEIVWRANPAYKYLGQGSFRGDVIIDGKKVKTLYAKAVIKAYAEVLVANHSVSRGELLTSDNVRLEKHDLSTLTTGMFLGIDEIDGMIAKSSIQAGKILSPTKVMMPKIVKRNQIVRVRTQIGSLVIQSQAQAMSDGSVGDILRCRNLQSKEEFSGIVGKDGVLTVY
jgi:flagellar basal body P-ring formation protein FlgA